MLELAVFDQSQQLQALAEQYQLAEMRSRAVLQRLRSVCVVNWQSQVGLGNW